MTDLIPTTTREPLDVIEAQSDADAPRGAVLVAALRAAVAGWEDFTALTAAVLTEVHDERHYQPAHRSFTAFVRAELPFGLRTAQQMVRVSRTLRALGISHERLRNLGWSKLAVVAGALTPAAVERVLADVAALTFAQLKVVYAPPRSGRTATPPSLVVTPVILATMTRAAVEAGLDPATHRQECLDWVCRRFLDAAPERPPTEPIHSAGGPFDDG